MFHGSSQFSHMLGFLRNPERFVSERTAKWGPTWYFHLAGRKLLVTSDPQLVRSLFGSSTQGLFLPEPLQEVLGSESILFQNGEKHTRVRTQLRTAMSGVSLTQVAEQEALRMCQETLEPLTAPFHLDLMLAFRKYLFRSTVQMLMGNQRGTSDLLQAWEVFMSRLHPLLLMPPHPSFRFSFWGMSPWDRCCSARDKVRSLLVEMVRTSIPGYPAERLSHDMRSEDLIDQIMTILFGSLDNPAISLAWMLDGHQKNPGILGPELLKETLETHPPIPLIPHVLHEPRPDLELKKGDGVAIAPQFLEGSAFGFGPHVCLGASWAKVLMKTAFQKLRPYLQGHKIRLGLSKRQRFSWGPSEVWIST